MTFDPFSYLFGANDGASSDIWDKFRKRYSTETPTPRQCMSLKDLADWFMQAGNAAGAIAKEKS